MTSTTRKWLRILAGTGIGLLVLLGSLHLWFSTNAARYLEGVVARQSKGALQLKVKGFSFNYFTGFVEVRQGTLTSLDSTTNPATYNIKLDKLTLHLKSFWPLLLERRLLLDSVLVHNPQVEIFRWRKDPALQRDLVSLPSELGRMYQSLLDGLDDMQLKHISIRNAGFTVYNKIRPDRPPVKLAGVNFALNYQGNSSDTTNRDAYMPGVQNVSLHIPAQSLVLPDGKHQLNFNKLELELFRQRLQLDSCTISTIDGLELKAHYNLFFRQLLLTGVDFDALYRQNLVRADSVYCLAPMFQISIEGGAKKDTSNNRQPPDFQEVVNDLVGNFDLRFVGVKEAGFNIAINGAKKRTLSNDRRDDFAMHGLRINPDSTEPLTVQEFDMNVRDYSLYNEDSSTVFHFDSVQLRNSRLVLRQFSANTTARNNPGRTIRKYNIPYFELQGINWAALLFDERLEAESAILGAPNIYVKAGTQTVKRKRVSLFDALQSAESQISLQKITVHSGQLHLLPASGTEIKLSNANLSIKTESLLQARTEAGIKESVEQLQFDRGTLRFGNTTVALNGLHFEEGRGLMVQNLLLQNNAAEAKLQDVSLRDLVFNKETNHIEAEALRWRSGTVLLKKENKPAVSESPRRAPGFRLTNIDGAKTRLTFEQGPTRLQAHFQNLHADAISQTGNNKPEFSGLSFLASPVHFEGKYFTVKTGTASLRKGKQLHIENLDLLQQKGPDTLALKAESVSGTVDPADLLSGKMQVGRLSLLRPELRIQRTLPEQPTPAANPISIDLDEVQLVQPQLSVTMRTADSSSTFWMPRSNDGLLQLRGVSFSPAGIGVDKIALRSGPAWLTQRNGNRIGTEKGSIGLALSQLRRSINNGKPSWSGTLDSISLLSPNAFSLSKGARLHISEASGGNLQLQGNNLNALLQNPAAWLRTGTATYRDSNTVMHWEGARYEAGKKTLSLDTFSVRPALSREVKIATSLHQIDYITFTSGPVTLTGFDREQLEKDSAFAATSITLQRPTFTIYRDKRPPFLKGQIKPLPVNAIKGIRLPVDVGKIVLQNGLLVYTELAEKSNEEGIISLTNLNATIGNIRNRNIQPNDSLQLRIDALLLDSAQLSLNLKESYTDSLAGFLMHLRMKPTSLTFLNPIVAPLASVQIQSGTVDSLFLNAIGREYEAFGEMHLFYRNLRIKFVQVGENNRSKVVLRLLTSLANTFFIRKNNNGRESLMYFERLRDRSFFNYIVKMTFSGLASGVGAKKNKKALRNYRHELEGLRGHPYGN